MNASRKRRAGVLATFGACLVLLTSPAAANPSHSVTITGGILTLTPGPLNLALTSAGCPAGTATIAHDETVSPHTFDVTALSVASELLVAGNTYRTQITRTASTAGTHAAGTLNSVKVRLSVVIRGPIVSGSCALGAVRCTINMTTDLDLSGTFTNGGGGNAAEPETGDVAYLNNVFPNATVAGMGCLPPFTGFNGGGTASVLPTSPIVLQF